jgi:hypothetical protein
LASGAAGWDEGAVEVEVLCVLLVGEALAGGCCGFEQETVRTTESRKGKRITRLAKKTSFILVPRWNSGPSYLCTAKNRIERVRHSNVDFR